MLSEFSEKNIIMLEVGIEDTNQIFDKDNNMGGPPKNAKARNYKELEKNKEIWEHFIK